MGENQPGMGYVIISIQYCFNGEDGPFNHVQPPQRNLSHSPSINWVSQIDVYRILTAVDFKFGCGVFLRLMGSSSMGHHADHVKKCSFSENLGPGEGLNKPSEESQDFTNTCASFRRSREKKKRS